MNIKSGYYATFTDEIIGEQQIRHETLERLRGHLRILIHGGFLKNLRTYRVEVTEINIEVTETEKEQSHEYHDRE